MRKQLLKLKKNIGLGIFRGFCALLIFPCGLILANDKSSVPQMLVPVEMEFVKIPDGCFMMGDNNGYDYEKPEHEVCVNEFYIGRFEVTQKQWSLLMNENRARFLGDELPAQRISWNDAMEYIRRLNKQENTTRYRLPTEAEWEWAARGGSTTRYFWGDEISNEHAWYYGSSDFKAHRVGTSLPNGFGLYDMLGNVWEWVSDWYDGHYYEVSPKMNPKGPETGTLRTRRGGSMANLASYVRSASRYRSKLDKRHYIFGFRVAYSSKVSD